jgi:glycosyltransferase involved in cell wall biosynthesis
MLVSIIIDNYNYDTFIAQAIESALAQTYAPLEVLVVDDGSSDGSMATIGRYAERVQVISKPNGGQGSAYNAGFLRSRGDLVIFLDADDWLYPDAVTEIVAALRPGVSKVQFRLDMVDAQGVRRGRQLPRDLHDGALAMRLVSDHGTYGSPPGSGNAFTAAFLRQVLPMDEPRWRIGADSIPILLAPAYGEVVSVARALGAYRVHRAANDGSLLYNNWVSGLLGEYRRIVDTKAMVVEGLRRARAEHRPESLLAPWEARFMVLAGRFGEPELRAILASHLFGRLSFQLGSIWRWPAASWQRKLLFTAWCLGVRWAPTALALRLARLHRRESGLPVVATTDAAHA